MKKALVAVAVCVAAVGMGVVPAAAARAGTTTSFTVTHNDENACVNFHTPPVSIKATFRLHRHGTGYSGSVTLQASNHNAITHQVFYEQVDSEIVGTFIVYGAPVAGDTWYLVTGGVVGLSDGGYITGVPTGATDLCAVLGADA